MDLDSNFIVNYALTRGSHLKDLRPAAEKDRCHALTAFEVDRIRENGSRFLSNAVSKKRTKNNTLSPLLHGAILNQALSQLFIATLAHLWPPLTLRWRRAPHL